MCYNEIEELERLLWKANIYYKENGELNSDELEKIEDAWNIIFKLKENQ